MPSVSGCILSAMTRRCTNRTCAAECDLGGFDAHGYLKPQGSGRRTLRFEAGADSFERVAGDVYEFQPLMEYIHC